MPSLLEFRRVLRSEEHTSELQSLTNLVCRLLLEKKTMDMSRFPTPAHLSAWAQFAPGVKDSAGRKKCTGSTGFVFFFNDTATTEIYTLSLHDALPIYPACRRQQDQSVRGPPPVGKAWPH